MMWNIILGKVKKLDEASTLVEIWKNAGDKIVWTNGCFDILHLGHLKYLCKARDLGDRLVVGVNSDTSVERLKGSDRPILDQKTRLSKIAALQAVDLVIMFDEDTPIIPIKLLRPDVLVKGGDYEPNKIVGAREVKEWDGTVSTIAFEEGQSTSEILRKIQTLKDVD